jgi:hypothetical protein
MLAGAQQMLTASTSGSATSARQSVRTRGISYWLACCCARASSMSAIATTRAASRFTRER